MPSWEIPFPTDDSPSDFYCRRPIRSCIQNAVRLDQIQIFPIKSLDGVCLDEVRITAGGILEHDRVWAIFDEAGRVVNGKRTARVHELRCEFGAGVKEVRLGPNAQSTRIQFPLDDTARLAKWLSEFFGFAIELRHNPVKGFPDDLTAFGPTIVSKASLQAIQTWFPELTMESLRRRFRANLELEGCEPFGEDRLFGAPDELKPFPIGAVNFLGHNPCQRCVVPTRDPDSGQGLTDFQKKFMELRKKFLPPWANAQRFNHFYRFAVNTSIPPSEAGKILRVGDGIQI
jgi:uncharacterized protein YcbX